MFPSSHTALACKSTSYLHESTYLTTCLDCLFCSRLGMAEKTAPSCQKSALCSCPFFLRFCSPFVLPSGSPLSGPRPGIETTNDPDRAHTGSSSASILVLFGILRPIWCRSRADLGLTWGRLAALASILASISARSGGDWIDLGLLASNWTSWGLRVSGSQGGLSRVSGSQGLRAVSGSQG